MNNENSGKGGLWFLLGAIAGAAAGFYLNSAEGRRFRERMAEQATDYGRTISEQAQNQYSHLSSNVNSALEQGKTYVNEFGKTVKTKIDEVANTAKSAVGSIETGFQKGMNKAKEEASRRKEQIDEIVENNKH